MIESYPLAWPVGYKRTPGHKRTSSRFEQTPEKAQNFLRHELQRMGARDLIISSNVMVRRDGLLYSDMANTNLDDPGISIYFKYKGKDVSCCDQYKKPWENIYALGKGIEALRGMERWGVSEFLERAFTGFKALPEVIIMPFIDCWSILELTSAADEDDVRNAYRKLAARYHPDNIETGDAEKFIVVQKAYEEAIGHFEIA